MRSLLTMRLLLALAGPALAVDGVLEINQTCAVETGCFSGDVAEYPVRLQQSGSDRLTSNLTLPGMGLGISSSTGLGDVSIDLNGFTIDGAGSSINGIQLFTGDNWEIRNGTVKGFSNGIQQAGVSTGHRIIGVRVSGNTGAGIAIANGEGHLVQDCTVTENGGVGIWVAKNSRGVGNTVTNNTGLGMFLSAGTDYSGNVVNDNDGGTVSNGVNAGGNVCNGDTTCP